MASTYRSRCNVIWVGNEGDNQRHGYNTDLQRTDDWLAFRSKLTCKLLMLSNETMNVFCTDLLYLPHERQWNSQSNSV